jgi:hydrogenase-4 component F
MLQAAPFSALLLMAGGLALVGTPPFNIFISKFTIFSGGIQAGYLWLMGVCLLFLAIVFAAFLRVITSTVFGEVPEGMPRGDIRPAMLAPLAALVILILVLGVYIPPDIGLLLSRATSIAISGNELAEAPGLFVGGSYGALPVVFAQIGQLFTP